MGKNMFLYTKIKQTILVLAYLKKRMCLAFIIISSNYYIFRINLTLATIVVYLFIMPPKKQNKIKQRRGGNDPCPIRILNVTVHNNPAPFFSPLQFEIQFECLKDLQGG